MPKHPSPQQAELIREPNESIKRAQSGDHQPAVAPAKEIRRARRHEVRLRAVLRGTDESGRDFFDRGEVVSIDQHGARVRTRFVLKVGSELTLQMANDGTSKRLRVVWRGDPESFEADMAGVEFVDPNDTWNIEALRSQ